MRKIVSYLVFLLSVTGLYAAGPDKDRFIDAVTLYAEGHIAAAMDRFSELLELSPDDDAVNYYMGMCEMSLEKYAEATEHLEKAAAADTANLWYVNALASLYGATDNRAKFVECCEKLVNMNPGAYSNPYTLTIIGDSRLSQHLGTLALEKYNQALEIDPEYLPARIGRIEVYRMSNNMPAFFSELGKIVEDEGVDVRAKVSYLEAVMNSMDSRFYWVWGKTLGDLVNKCAGLHPEDLQSNYLKLQILIIEQEYAAALEQCGVLAAAAERAGDKDMLATAYNIEGDVAHMTGDRKRSYRAYDAALSVDPDRTAVLNNYAYYLSEEGRSLKKAIRMSRRAVELEPDNATYLDTLGWLLYLTRKPKEAKPLFKRAMIYGGKDSAVVLEHYSKVLEALGEEDLSRYYKSLSEQKQN